VPTIRIPSPMRRLTAGAATVEVAGTDVAAVLAAVDAQHPGVLERVVAEDGRLHRFVHVFVGGADVRDRDGLATPVGASDTVTIVPAVAGGAGAAGRGQRLAPVARRRTGPSTKRPSSA
jgi:sulfur-carrier protein